ncbi:MAG: hypothetical protein RR185_09885 [Angelakisella sp.]
MVFAALVMVGTVNAVNITDGIDGLCSGVTIPVALFFTVVAAAWGYGTVAYVAASLVGALLAFLFYNFHPAKVFMGDTGSHSLFRRHGLRSGLRFGHSTGPPLCGDYLYHRDDVGHYSGAVL